MFPRKNFIRTQNKVVTFKYFNNFTCMFDSKPQFARNSEKANLFQN